MMNKPVNSQEDCTPKIRSMQLADKSSLMRLKTAEGWNQTERDLELLITYPSSVNLVAVVADKIVGSVTAINYSDAVAWIGMMLVDKSYRGRGISKRLLSSILNQLQGFETIKLDATPEGHPVYVKIGFSSELILGRMINSSLPVIPERYNSSVAESIQPPHLPEIIAYDHKVFGANRKELIKHLYYGAPKLAWGIWNEQQLSGFCLGRAGSRYTQVGPLYASSEEVARTLLSAVLNQLTGEACVIDIHSGRGEIERWLRQVGFKKVRTFERMYLVQNSNPGIVSKQYLISGPELG